MSTLLADAGHPLRRSELWSTWSSDIVLWSVLALLAIAHVRGSRSRRLRNPSSEWAFRAGIVAIGAALLSPLDALAGSLASAHMGQHLLLTMVAAPLFAVGAPGQLARSVPRRARRLAARWRTSRPGRLAVRSLRHPLPWALVHVVTVWVWHAATPYETALENDVVHRLEHLTFLATAAASWTALLGRAARRAGNDGMRVMTLFVLSVQGAVLGALLTFAPSPWYPSYRTTTGAWGLTPLADQQLAGVIMWVPAGVIYLAAALLLLVRWIGRDSPQSERVERSPVGPMSAASATRADSSVINGTSECGDRASTLDAGSRSVV